MLHLVLIHNLLADIFYCFSYQLLLQMMLLLSLFLMLLSGCSGVHPNSVTQVKLSPPAILMQPCDKPKVGEIVTNADLLRVLSRYMEAFDICVAKHDALVKAIKEGE